MITPQEADEKVDYGYMRVIFIFEALAVSEDAVKSALEQLIEKMDNDEKCKLYKKSFSKTEKREKPLKNIETAYSITVEVEAIVKKFDDLMRLVIEYGPSAVEIVEPAKFEMSLGEAQDVLNIVSTMMHEFASAGIGGLVLVRKAME